MNILIILDCCKMVLIHLEYTVMFKNATMFWPIIIAPAVMAILKMVKQTIKIYARVRPTEAKQSCQLSLIESETQAITASKIRLQSEIERLTKLPKFPPVL